mmetsp:Transcript_9106/g.20849  ORF Transcript_9106/g.20849 Transcript_9106/m.20849 type:complete len:253 (-) Transcript_9106:163-921(-)
MLWWTLWLFLFLLSPIDVGVSEDACERSPSPILWEAGVGRAFPVSVACCCSQYDDNDDEEDDDDDSPPRISGRRTKGFFACVWVFFDGCNHHDDGDDGDDPSGNVDGLYLFHGEVDLPSAVRKRRARSSRAEDTTGIDTIVLLRSMVFWCVVRSFVRSLFSEQKILRWAYRSCAPWSANRKPKTEKGPIHPSIHPSVPPSPSSFDPSLSRLSILRWVLPPRRRKDDLGGRRKDNAMRNTTARDILPTRQYSS